MSFVFGWGEGYKGTDFLLNNASTNDVDDDKNFNSAVQE
jgi:hypothetical protein